MKKTVAFLLACMMVLSLVACGFEAPAETPAETPVETPAETPADTPQVAPEEVITLKVSSSLPQGDYENAPQGYGARYFMEELTARSNGKFQFEYYGGSQLGSTATEFIGGCQMRSHDMIFYSSGNYGSFTDGFAESNIPFLFSDDEVARQYLSGPIAEAMSAKVEADTGLKVLAYLPIGFRHLTNNRGPVSSPEDMQGLKLRTMNDRYQIATMEAFGASATAMPLSEVYSALQQKLIDGQENPFSNMVGSQLHEVQKYLTTTSHQYTITVIAINAELFYSLSEEDQQLMMEVAAEAQDYAASKSVEIQQQFREMVEGTYLEITDLTPEQQQAFKDACAPVWDMIADEIGQERFDAAVAEVERIETELGMR